MPENPIATVLVIDEQLVQVEQELIEACNDAIAKGWVITAGMPLDRELKCCSACGATLISLVQEDDPRFLVPAMIELRTGIYPVENAAERTRVLHQIDRAFCFGTGQLSADTYHGSMRHMELTEAHHVGDRLRMRFPPREHFLVMRYPELLAQIRSAEADKEIS